MAVLQVEVLVLTGVKLIRNGNKAAVILKGQTPFVNNTMHTADYLMTL